MDSTVVHQLLDVMHQTEHPPLSLYLVFATQREAIQSLVGADIPEYRFDNRHTMTVYCFSFQTINPIFHPVRRRLSVCPGKRHLPTVPIACIRRCGITHALVFERAMSTVCESPFKEELLLSFTDTLLSIEQHFIASGTDTRLASFIQLEFACRQHLLNALCSILMSLAVLLFLLGKRLVAGAELVVRDVSVDAFISQKFIIGFAGESGVRRDDDLIRENLVGNARIPIALINAVENRL